jgi:NTE family protein
VAASPKTASNAGSAPGGFASLLDRLPFSLGQLRSGPAESTELPTILDVLAISLDIMQLRITRSRLSGEPADAIIRPRLSHFALLDFHRAEAAIEEGQRAAESALPYLRDILGG